MFIYFEKALTITTMLKQYNNCKRLQIGKDRDNIKDKHKYGQIWTRQDKSVCIAQAMQQAVSSTKFGA